MTKRPTATGVSVAAAMLLAALGTSGPVEAEEWLIVPITDADEATPMLPAVEVLERALAQRGISTSDGKDAAKRFERLVSAPAHVLTDEQLDQWAARSRRALDLLARTDYQGALRELETAQALSRSAVEVLNRDPNTAATLLDTCLYTVRALLGVGKRATARIQAQECARLSPAAEPNVKMHPPDLRTFYEDVVDASRSAAGSISVVSEPSGCPTWVNGVSFGQTPAHIERLPAGTYAVQVECDERPGRVHRVAVERGTAKLRVDMRFDRAVRTDERVHLQYSEPPTPARRAADAKTLAQALEVDAVVFVSTPGEDRVELAFLDADGRARGTVYVATSAQQPEASELQRAIGILLGDTPPRPERQRPPRGQFIAGVSLASVGAASLVSGYALYTMSATKLADEMVDLPSNDNQSQWLNTRFGMFYVGSAGAAMLVTAMPLALPYRAKTPWWGWLAGGAGLALTATSIALAVTAPPNPDVSRVADPQGYVDRAKRTDAAFLAGVTAVPLLTMPLVYLLRRDDKRSRAELAPQVLVSRAGGFVGLRGRY